MNHLFNSIARLFIPSRKAFYLRRLSSISASLFFFGAAQSAFAADTWTTDINASALYMQQGNKTSATTLLKDALKAANSPYEQYEASRLLGKLYFDERDYDNAELQLKASLAFGRQCPFVSSTREAEELYAIMIKRGRNAEAVKFHKLCEQLQKVEANHDSPLQGWGDLLVRRIAEKLYVSPNAVTTGKSESATCRWVMSRAGRPLFIHLVKSSGSVSFDEAVCTAVQNYAPPITMPEQAYDFEEIEIPFPQMPKAR